MTASPSSSPGSSSSSRQLNVSNHNERISNLAPPGESSNTQNDSFPRSLSAPSSRTSSFSSGLDQLAFINQSAHTFPANLTSLSSTSTDSTYSTLSPSGHVRAARSTPSSPRLGPSSSSHHHERRAISRPSSPSFSRRSSGSGQGSLQSHSADEPWRVRRKRARSWVNMPGAGFTPATAPDTHSRNGLGSIANRSVRSQRHVSTPETNLEALHARPDANLRMRSTSASGSVASASGAERSSRIRQPSLSARVSPAMTLMQPLTPMEAMTPHRTHSVPHFSRTSPLLYGYSYRYPSGQDSQHSNPSDMATVLDGYFALPTTNDRAPPNISPLDGEDMPPPYTASQVDLLALDNSIDQHRSQGADLREDDDVDDAILSFSTMSRESREDENVESNELRRRRRDMREGNDILDNNSHTQSQVIQVKEERATTSHQLRSFVLLYILHPLRLLAALPGSLGTFWLLRNAVFLTWMNGSVWQQDNGPGALEFWMASLWSLTTAYHALSFTTLLLRRWLHYYSILPSFIRLVALQAICWPLVRLTLYIVGPNNPLASWMIISTTTAFSDTVARWVVSNITDEMSTKSEQDNSSNSYRSSGRKRQKRRRTGMAFWRAVMGGPSDTQDHDRMRSQRLPFTESEADSDVDSLRNHRNARRSDNYTNGFQSDITSGGEESLIEQERLVRSQRVARIFHWDVAIQRNILPIAILAYLSLGAMLLEQVRQRAS